MNREYEVSSDVFLIKYFILNKLLDRYSLECNVEEKTKLNEILDIINQDLAQDDKETDVYKIGYYKKCLDYAKRIGISEDNAIVKSVGIIEDDIIPVYLDIEEARIRFEEFIEDITQDTTRSFSR